MSSEKSLTPQIRFKGFTEAWEQRKLGELYTPASEKNDGSIGRDRIISVANMYFNPVVYVTDDEYLKTYNVMRLGDIAFEGNRSKRYAHGRFVENFIGDGIISHVFKVFRPRLPFDLLYWKYAINNELVMRDVLTKSTKASTMMHELVSQDFLKEGIAVPSCLDEERQIGALFAKLDDLIALHQRKLDAIKKIKSALLEKMFPKDGSDIPEIRFTGFTEAWEQRKLGDYGLVQMCRRIYKDQTSEIGDVPFFKIGTFGGQPDAFISRSLFQDYRKQYPFPSVGTPLISAAGSIGRTVIYQGEEAYFQDSNIVWLDNNEKLNNVFLNSLYKKIDWKLEGSTIKRLYNKDILNAEVCVPSTLEQCQVGSFFAHLDSLITLHQRKLDALKKIKSALLEKMFV